MEAVPDPELATDGAAPKTLRDSAVILAIATALLYLCGSVYLGSYYGGLGLPDGEVQRDVAAVLEASFLPLFHIGAFVFIVGVFIMMLPPKSPSGSFAPFHPIPTTRLLAVVLTFWAFKVLVDFINPPAPVFWLSFQRRSVLFYAFLILVVVSLYLLHRMSGRKWRHLSNWSTTYWTSGLLGLALLLGVYRVASGGGWPYSPWQNVFFGAVAIYLVAATIWTRKSARDDRSTAEESGSPGVLGYQWSTSMAAFSAFVAALMLVLGAGVSGSVAAQEALAGCTARDSIEFDPLPPGLEANATHWLVLHQDGVYYVRQVEPEPAAYILVVHEGPGLSARIGSMAPTAVC